MSSNSPNQEQLLAAIMPQVSALIQGLLSGVTSRPPAPLASEPVSLAPAPTTSVSAPPSTPAPAVPSVPVVPPPTSISAPSTQPPSQPIGQYRSPLLNLGRMVGGAQAPVASASMVPGFSATVLGASSNALARVNEERRASASRLPSRRPRGRAVAPPATVPSQLNKRIYTLPQTGHTRGEGTMRVRCKALPRHIEPTDRYYVYKTLGQSFGLHLKSFGLVKEYEVPMDCRVSDLSAQFVNDIRNADFQYQLPDMYSAGSSSTVYSALEASPLALMYVSNKARPSGIFQQVHLERYALNSAETVRSLAENRNKFAMDCCIENRDCALAGRNDAECYLALHFQIRKYPLVALNAAFSPNAIRRAHSCFPQKIYGPFPIDSFRDWDIEASDSLSTDDEGAEDTASSISTHGRTVTESDADEQMEVEQAVSTRAQSDESFVDERASTQAIASTPRTTTRSMTNSVAAQNIIQAPFPVPATAAFTPQSTSTVAPSPSPVTTVLVSPAPLSPPVPVEVWTEGAAALWTRPPYDLSLANDDLFRRVNRYVARPGAYQPLLSITGGDVNEAALDLIRHVKSALDQRDFSTVLSRRRHFSIRSTNGSTSLGEGVEREVVQTALQLFTVQDRNQYLLERIDDFYTLSLQSPSLRGTIAVSSERLQSWRTFGALVGLAILYDIPPVPLSPLLLHFIIQKCNLHCLTRQLVREWHPSFYIMLDAVIQAGPDGNLGAISDLPVHYQVYHGQDLRTVSHRSPEDHKALAVDLLYHGIVGSVVHTSPEFGAFIEGLNMRCENNFTLLSVLRQYPGGSESLLNQLWTTHISTTGQIEPYLSIIPPVTGTANHSVQDSLDAVRLALNNPVFHFNNFIKPFLACENSRGPPCPAVMGDIRPFISPLVNLEDADSAGFRARTWCWAITGQPSLPGDTDTKISITVVSDTDPMYFGGGSERNRETRRGYLNYGKICFRTCARQAFIPASFFARLARTEYPTPNGGPANFEEAVEHWFFCEGIGAIGNHSIL